MVDAEREPLFEHYNVDKDMIKRFDTKVAAQSTVKTFADRYAAGERLGWVFDTVTIGGRSEKRMFVCYHDKDGNPIDVPTRFPALEIVLPAAPVKGAYLSMADALRYNDGNVGAATQKFVFDHETTDGRFESWCEAARHLDDVLNGGRCKFLATNAEAVAGTYLSAADLKYLKKHGPEKLENRLKEALEDPNNRSQHQCRFWCPKSNLFVARKNDGPVLKVSPADQKVLDTPGFDDSGKIRNHLESADSPLSLRLLKIVLPGSTAAGNTVLPNELDKVNTGAIASMKLTVYSLYKRPTDDQHSVSCANTGVLLLTNGPARGGGVAEVDMMAELRATKAPRDTDMMDELRATKKAKTV
jgi:hypothetical protein